MDRYFKYTDMLGKAYYFNLKNNVDMNKYWKFISLKSEALSQEDNFERLNTHFYVCSDDRPFYKPNVFICSNLSLKELLEMDLHFGEVHKNRKRMILEEISKEEYLTQWRA